ncbi:MAG TPA: helicase C-terminal domain-containing protein, partial [Nitrososphaeraceae archaeon]
SVMLDGAVGGQWIINEYDPGRSILIKPIFAWQVADYALFRKADQFLHMSATICGFDAYAGVLGLKEGEFECLEIPNPIPVANRRVYVVANQKISGNYDIKKLASDVDKLILRHGEQNGIIHTVSYKLANELYVNSSLKHRMLVSKDREEIMNELKQVNTGRIVLSAGFVRGFDFKGDMSRYQIQLKVPFDFLGDPLVKLNAERRGDWYARSAILKLVQSCGRSIRGVDDYATTYIMDMNFKRLYSQNRDLFPSWFCDSVVMKPE